MVPPLGAWTGPLHTSLGRAPPPSPCSGRPCFRRIPLPTSACLLARLLLLRLDHRRGLRLWQAAAEVAEPGFREPCTKARPTRQPHQRRRPPCFFHLAGQQLVFLLSFKALPLPFLVTDALSVTATRFNALPPNRFVLAEPRHAAHTLRQMRDSQHWDRQPQKQAWLQFPTPFPRAQFPHTRHTCSPGCIWNLRWSDADTSHTMQFSTPNSASMMQNHSRKRGTWRVSSRHRGKRSSFATSTKTPARACKRDAQHGDACLGMRAWLSARSRLLGHGGVMLSMRTHAGARGLGCLARVRLLQREGLMLSMSTRAGACKG
eukprot:362927-Chlamydomonas_euryale.AAC.1